MKGEEKHRLDENELQRLVTSVKDKSRPFLEQYGNTLLLAVSATVLVVAIAVYISRDQAGAQAKGWDPLGVSLLTPGGGEAALETVADSKDFADTVPSLIAKVQLAQRQINRGVQKSFSQTASARDELIEAKRLLEEALGAKDPGLPPVINAQAMFALAECFETTWNGTDGKDNPIKAYDSIVQTYEKSLDTYPEISPYVSIAKRRIKRLESSESQAFYAWFREQELNPEKVAQMRAAVSATNFPPTSPNNTGLPSGHPAIEPYVPSAFDKWGNPNSILDMLIPAPELESSPFPDDTVPDEGERKVKPIPGGTDDSTTPDAGKPESTTTPPANEKPPVKPIPDGTDAATTPDASKPKSTITPPANEKPPIKPIPDETSESSDATKVDDADKAAASNPSPEASKPGTEDKPETP